ncbi:shikimate kinase [Leptolyngbya sp. NIES-2104]|uniref:shikimate kinase n=1 Tax=Leptolyngbya sp. NIES-2104 TaxID=1552121 RepID=UPI0006EC6225|nr:shikimate kinase [Leptolyngbya sp. NIES-2104]GAP97445.1 shikimate kinase I [Leptolyngbya sp. NIES-2104]
MLNGVSVFLIGMMGVGKTTIGQLLAKQLDYEFLDVDQFIEQATGQTVSTIFAESGEAIFRQLETATLSQVSARLRRVVATGGGIVLAQENWSYLRHGVIIWLDVPVEQLKARLSQDTTRPLLQSQDLTARLTQLSEERRSRYAQADIHIQVLPDETPEQITARIMNAIALECEKKRQIDNSIRRLNEEMPFQANS